MNRTGKLLSTSPVSEVANDELKEETKVLKVYIVLQFNEVLFYNSLDYENISK